jgi:hypothetical protein
MPVVLRMKGYKFLFYEADLDEPSHIHIGKEGKEAKFWLEPVEMARTGRFKPIQLREIKRIIDEHRDDLVRAWKNEQDKHVDR